ncbi:MAG: hypothetical protein EPN21_13355 [Methylococcaceae bacterium]|nr:MAG: hypothetical protein EPN21_13355 [Methylococcaceae bacterium]
MSQATQPTAPKSEIFTAEPVVIEPRKRKKKYSKGLRAPQELLVVTSKATEKAAAAVQIALENWIERNDKSSEKRRDGLLKDGLMNIGRATHKGLRKALKAPETFMDELEETKLYKRRFKLFRLIG